MTSAAFVAALKPLLEARAGLAGVTVHLTEPETPSAPMIVLIARRVTHEIDWAAFGPKRTDEGTVPGRIWTRADTMQAAANAAFVIATEIATQVVDTPPAVGAQTLRANVDTVDWLPQFDDEGGVFCDMNYTVVYRADLA